MQKAAGGEFPASRFLLSGERRILAECPIFAIRYIRVLDH